MLSRSLAEDLGERKEDLIGRPLAEVDRFPWGPNLLGELVARAREMQDGEEVSQECSFEDASTEKEKYVRIVVTCRRNHPQILIEDSDGGLANGSGPVFFVGRTNQGQNSVRRGLVYFDVAAALPANARVETVRLTLYMSPSNSASHRISLRFNFYLVFLTFL